MPRLAYNRPPEGYIPSLSEGWRFISNDDYHHKEPYSQALSKSGLVAFARSPAHFKASQDSEEPTEPSHDMELGTVFHHLLLEPEKANWVLWKEPRRGKAWTDFKEKHADKVILTEEEVTMLFLMRDSILSIKSIEALMSLNDKQIEASGFWKESDIWCKSRPDYMSGIAGVIADVKTCADASPEGFGRQAANLKYHWQAAWYTLGLERLTGAKLDFLFLCVEKKPPYAAVCYRATPEMIELGRQEIAELLPYYKECLEKDVWPGYAGSHDIMNLELPGWAYRRKQ